jgi:hypothetical protein
LIDFKVKFLDRLNIVVANYFCILFWPYIKEIIISDTLAILARNVGEENFRPLAWESLNLGIQLVKSSGEEADLRKASYGLFAAIATVLKGEMAPALQEIVPFLLQSIKSKDGIVVCTNSNFF